MIAKAERRGPWITTYPMGIRFYPQTPKPEDVDIHDIAHSLPMQARFLGHTSRFYSVGEHSCHVADWIWKVTEDRVAAACGLLHDGEETYVGDMPRPIKHYGPLQVYRSLCGRASAAIFAKFGLGEAYAKHESLIKTADDQLLHTESRRLNHKAEWEDNDKILSDADLHIDQYAEQQVIDLLREAVDNPDPRDKVVEAIVLLKLGGVHRRWHDEFMDRFERWVR
jgi:5'-deoxynucleotidase YfbR-like HD superfamily hydrolase